MTRIAALILVAMLASACGSFDKIEARLIDAEERIERLGHLLDELRQLNERQLYQWMQHRELDEAEREAWRRAVREAREGN